MKLTRNHILCVIAIGLAACVANPVTQTAGTPTLPATPTVSAQPSATPLAIVTVPPLPTETALPPTSTPQPTTEPSPTPTRFVSLMAVGDIMLARSIGDTILAQGPGSVFAGLAKVLNTADLLVGNLECAITSAGQPEPKAYTFAAPPEAASALGAAGFDVLSLANNHALDYGPEGLFETQQLLSAQGIAGVGAGADEGAAHAPVVIEKNGLRIAFLAYVDVPVESGGFDTRVWIAGPEKPGVAWIDPARIQSEVAQARTTADLVVALLHFGWEGRTTVYPEQKAAARAAIDGGAALVIGSHPHVLQVSEQYHGGFIAYSLGNFVFDGFGIPENYTAILSATLTPEGVAEVQWIPVVIERGLPRPATPDESAIILRMVGGG